MNCRQSRRLFSRHVDQRLGEGERRELDAHLAGCALCRAELLRWEVPACALRALGPAAVPDDLAERSARAAIVARPSPSFEERFVWAARRAAAAGALAAALVWGGLLWREPVPGEADIGLPPDEAEMAMSLWGTDPIGEPFADTTPAGETPGDDR
jgi:anti-sigma factor RsiW